MDDNKFLDYDGLGHFYTKLKADPTFMANGGSDIPAGLIAMWSGIEVPEGWVLCDGNNDTPNLSDKFIVGTTNLKDNMQSVTIKEAGSLFTAGEEISYYKLAFIMKTESSEPIRYQAGIGISIKDGIISVKNPFRGIIAQSDFDLLLPEDQNKGIWFVVDVIDDIDDSVSDDDTSSGSIQHVTPNVDFDRSGTIVKDGVEYDYFIPDITSAASSAVGSNADFAFSVGSNVDFAFSVGSTAKDLDVESGELQ